MLRSVFTTFYRVRVWRCSSPWLSLYASTPSQFFSLADHQGSSWRESSLGSSVLKTKVRCFGTNYCLIDRDRWCLPKWKHRQETKNEASNRFLKFAFPRDLLIPQWRKVLENIPLCMCTVFEYYQKYLNWIFRTFLGRDEILGIWEFGNPEISHLF